MTGHTTHGVWLSFFALQVPLIVAERAILEGFRRAGVTLPELLRIAGTWLVVMGSAVLFWWPVEHYGISERVAGAVTESAAAALRALGFLGR